MTSTATRESSTSGHSSRSVGTTSTRRPKALNRRPDIQGLRAVAVSVVILDHLLAWPTGGFIGVDVFFVISGFLITGLLYREHEATGRISFTGFYARRIRRIIPISTLVLLVTVAASYIVYLPSRASMVTVDALWSLLFSMNWRLATLGTDYWAADVAVSPLQHYWSLAVEEQFYVIWPLLLVVVLSCAARLRWSESQRRRLLLLLITVATAASFVWALNDTATQPTWAYFSTFSRAWELGVGAVLAVLASTWSRLPGKVRPFMAWTGLAGILASLFVVSETNAFPAPWAALPVASTALVIIAGTGGKQRGLSPITNRVSVYVGGISYSLYLWHFPVLVLLESVVPTGLTYYAAALILTVCLSIFSFHSIEEPFRTKSWHLWRPAFLPLRRRAPRSRSQGGATPQPLRRLNLVLLLICINVVLVALALQSGQGREGAPSTTLALPAADQSPAADAEDLPPAAAAQAERISEALAEPSFPKLSPAIDDLGTEKWIDEIRNDTCSEVTAGNAAACELGRGAGKEVLVLGDSYAIAWLPGLREAFEGSNWNVHSLARGQCPAMSVRVTRDGGQAYPECQDHRKWALDQVKRIEPSLVIIADADNTAFRLASGSTGNSAQSEMQRGLQTTLSAVTPYAGRTVVLAPPPPGAALQECATRVSDPSDCVVKIRGDWASLAQTLESTSETGEADYVDTRGWFCSARGFCPSFVGTTPVRVDTGHLTIEYSESLAPVLEEAIIQRSVSR